MGIGYRIFFFLVCVVVLSSVALGLIGFGGGAFVTLVTPLNSSIELGGDVAFVYQLSNGTYQFDNCSFVVNDFTNQTTTNVTGDGFLYFYLEGLNSGTYNWSVTCAHSGLNTSSTSELRYFDVLIDSTPPSVSLNSPNDASVDTDGTVLLNYTVNDNGWVSKCELYTDLNNSWQLEQTNLFVRKNKSLYFQISNLSDDTVFSWNVLCYDLAEVPNTNWASNNRTVIVNNSAPIYTSIPNQTWFEDTINAIDLSNYFSDPDNDSLTYGYNYNENVSVTIDNETGVATFVPAKNWHGTTQMTFNAGGMVAENTVSDPVTIEVVRVNGDGDDPPLAFSSSPVDYFNSTDGYLFIECNATDDFGLSGIGLYTNIGGVWHLHEPFGVSGLENSTTFVIESVPDGSYNWACVAYDNSSQEGLGENKSISVSVDVDIWHSFSNVTVNHINHNRTIVLSYSKYLEQTLTLNSLTIYLSDGTQYFSRNFSNPSFFETNITNPPRLVYGEKVRVKYSEILYGNYSVGNEEWINVSLDYSNGGSNYQKSTIHTIRVVEAFV